MTAQHGDHDGALIPKPAMTFPALRRAVAIVAPSRLRELFEDMQAAFVEAGDEDSVSPIRAFHLKWAMIVEMERFPETARRLHAAERVLDGDDRGAADRAIDEITKIAQAAHREVAGG